MLASDANTGPLLTVESGFQVFKCNQPNTFTMRLSPEQIHAIVKATRAVLRGQAGEDAGEHAQVRLFGSRLDDSARGGDIDILVELPQPVQRPSLLAAQVTAGIQRALGDRKVDVLIIDPTTELQPVHRAAQREGLLLS